MILKINMVVLKPIKPSSLLSSTILQLFIILPPLYPPQNAKFWNHHIFNILEAMKKAKWMHHSSWLHQAFKPWWKKARWLMKSSFLQGLWKHYWPPHFLYIFPPLYPPQIFKVNDDFNIFIIHPITFSFALSTRQNKKMLQILKNMLKSLATFFDHFDDSMGETWAEFRGIEAAPLYI